jgi:hypothetical protein
VGLNTNFGKPLTENKEVTLERKVVLYVCAHCYESIAWRGNSGARQRKSTDFSTGAVETLGF